MGSREAAREHSASKLKGERDMYFRGTDIRQSANRQGGLVRDGSLCTGATDLRGHICAAVVSIGPARLGDQLRFQDARQLKSWKQSLGERLHKGGEGHDLVLIQRQHL